MLNINLVRVDCSKTLLVCIHQAKVKDAFHPDVVTDLSITLQSHLYTLIFDINCNKHSAAVVIVYYNCLYHSSMSKELSLSQSAQYVGPYRLEKTLGKGQTGE